MKKLIKIPLAFAVLVLVLFVLVVWRTQGGTPIPYFLSNSLAYQIFLATRGARLTDDRVIKFGERPLLSASGLQTIWPGPTQIRPLPAAALTMTLQSTDADDSQGGTGARLVLVKCLDATYFRFDQVVELEGLTPKAMDAPCLRIWRMQILDGDIGSTGTNEGTITAENGGTVYGFIQAGAGSSQSVSYTVPAERVIMISGILIGTEDQIEAQVWFDAPGVVPQSFRIRMLGQLPIPGTSICLPSGTDVELRAKSESGNAEVGAFISIYLVDKLSGRCYP